MYLITKPSGLIIRDMTRSDVAVITQLLNNTNVSRFMTYLLPMKYDEVAMWLDVSNELKYVIEQINPPYGVIGQFTIFEPDKSYNGSDGLEIAYLINPAFGNLGYSQEVLTSVIRFFEVTLGSVTFYAVVAKANIVMQHVIKKVGFVKVEDITYGKWDRSEIFDADLYVYRTYGFLNS